MKFKLKKTIMKNWTWNSLFYTSMIVINVLLILSIFLIPTLWLICIIVGVLELILIIVMEYVKHSKWYYPNMWWKFGKWLKSPVKKPKPEPKPEPPTPEEITDYINDCISENKKLIDKYNIKDIEEKRKILDDMTNLGFEKINKCDREEIQTHEKYENIFHDSKKFTDCKIITEGQVNTLILKFHKLLTKVSPSDYIGEIPLQNMTEINEFVLKFKKNILSNEYKYSKMYKYNDKKTLYPDHYMSHIHKDWENPETRKQIIKDHDIEIVPRLEIICPTSEAVYDPIVLYLVNEYSYIIVSHW
jgi:hypothetical protein